MKERPILFSAPMVRAILDGSKTQTRRVVKPLRRWSSQYPILDAIACAASHAAWWWDGLHSHVGIMQPCPYGKPGDRLWVRETFGIDDEDGSVLYFADPDTAQDAEYARACEDRYPRRRPSIHMPRWASRILLEITDVRVERLCDISEDDARAEGVTAIPDTGGDAGPNLFSISTDGGWLNSPTAAGAFGMLWEFLYGEGSWDANPWVWVVEFRRIES